MRKNCFNFVFLITIFSNYFLLSASFAENTKVKIISSLPRTGSANAQTSSIVNGIRLALEEAGNKAGNFDIVYEDLDDASPERGNWDPALEAANSDKAIADLSVVAYLGPFNSGAAKIAMPKFNQAQLPQISMAASYPGLTKPGKGEANEPRVYRPKGNISFFRVVPADDIQGSVAAKWAAEMGAKTVYILHDRELYGKGIADVFNKTAPQAGLKVLGFEGIDSKASNYRALGTKIRALKPDAVFFGGLTQTNGGQLAKDLRSAGVTSKLIVPDGCFESAFIEAAGKEVLEGNTYVTFGGVPAKMLTGKGQIFFQNYMKKYNLEPEGYSAYGYEAAKVVIEALKKVSDAGIKTEIRPALRAEIAKTKDFDGALGVWSFDDQGDTTLTTMSGNVVKNGDFEFVKLLGQ